MQFRRVGIFQGVLVLGPADPVLHGQVLDWLHVEINAFHLIQFRLQPAHHREGAHFSLFQGFEIDENAATVERGVDAIRPDE